MYYKFKSAKDYASIPIDGRFISIADLKVLIFKSKHLERGTDFDLIISNAQTNEEYLDEAMLIPKHTSVLVRRVPGLHRMPIVVPTSKPKVENLVEDDHVKSNLATADSSGFLDFEASELNDEFGSSPYATIPEMTPGQSNNTVQDLVSPSKADENKKIKALVENSGSNWQLHHTDGCGPGSFGRGRQGGRSFGRVGLESKTPPQGYVCHRCKVPGHFIQHCPTNGDPNYDIKKVRPPTGIPKSMLVPSLDGSYALPSGNVAVLKPDEAAFEKEMEGLSSTRSLGNIPPELHCPLCKEVMKDAVLSSKCCFGSFCDKCIRDYIISKSMCVCGARDLLADDLVPNKTLRDTINRILESPGNSSVNNAGIPLQTQDMESERCLQPRIPSPNQSAVSKGEQILPSDAKETPYLKKNVDGSEHSDAPQQQMQPQTSKEEKITEVSDVPEHKHNSVTVKEPAVQGSGLPVVEEVQQKVAAVEQGKKKKKRKVPLPAYAPGMQWMGMQPDMDSYVFPSAFNPCQPGMQPAVDGYMDPFGVNIYCNMGYGLGSTDMPFGNCFPPNSFGAQGFMMSPMLPLHQSRDPPKVCDYVREASSNAIVPPLKSKPKSSPIRCRRKSPREEHYDNYDHDSDHDLKRQKKRAYIDHDRDLKRGNHHRISRSHRSFGHTSHDTILCPTL